MKTNILWLPVIAVACALLTFSACKKDKQITTTIEDNSMAARDNNEALMALNSSTDDASNVFTDMPTGKDEGHGHDLSFCGVNTNTSLKGQGIISINYTGNTCHGNIVRTGTITITLVDYANGTRWDDAGATLMADLDNLNITNTETGDSYTFDGTYMITNETGGWAWMTMWGLSNNTVTYRHSASNFTVTFADGSQSIWNINRSKTFANTGGVKSVTISGGGSFNGATNLDVWGSTRNGTTFTAALTEPIRANTICGLYRPVTGEYNYVMGQRSMQIIYGVDAGGTPVSNGACPYGYQLSYTDGITNTKVYAYGHKK